jgi:hypothetical protein
VTGVIHIVLDFFGLSSTEKQDVVVENEQQYIDSRLKIREAIYNRSDLVIVVRSTRIANWYESFREHPDSTVTVKPLSPKSILVEKLALPGSLAMSFPLSDSEIVELNLTEKVRVAPPRSPLVTQRDIENWILAVCIDRCWSDSSASFTHLSKLVSFFLSGNADLANQSTLGELISRRKAEWTNSDLGGAYRWLLDEPVANSFLVYSLQILKDYKDPTKQTILAEIANKKLEPIIGYIDQIPSCECSNIPSKAELSNVVEIKWKNTLRNRFRYQVSETKEKDNHKALRERFDRVVSEAVVSMSGKIVGELDALITFTSDNPRYFSKGLFNLISAKFHRFPEKIRELEDLVPPRAPSLPRHDWDWVETSQWLVREYMPYAKWSLRHVQNDMVLEDCAKAYGDWLYDAYPKLKNELAPLNYGTWHLVKQYIDDGYQVLWLIIDNLCWFYIEDVKTAFREQGFYPTSTGTIPQLSMLPSETRISKSALVAGRLPCQIDPGKFQQYGDLFEERCKESGIHSYRAMPDRDLRTSKLGKHKVTCCIINKLDVSSHQGFFDFEDDVRNLLVNIAKYLRKFIPPEVASKKFCILVSTDHGSCKIPNYVKGCPVPNATTLEEQHRRFVYTDSEIGLQDMWYFLDKDRYGLNDNMAIVRGYGFAGSKRPKGLVHGGMTPEETFIPLLEFNLEPLEIKGIKCMHAGQPIHLSSRKQRVELLVRNPNDSRLSDVHIYVPSHSVEIDLDGIPGNDEKPVVIEIALPKEETAVSKENLVTLNGYYVFDYQGERKSGEARIDIRIRRIMDVSEAEQRLLEF